MEKFTLIERQENDNEPSVWSDVCSFFWAYEMSLFVVLLIVLCIIGWGKLCSFSMPWPKYVEYPSWNVGFGISYEPLGKGDDGTLAFGDIFEDYTSFGYLFRVVTLFYFLPFLASSLFMCFITSKRWKCAVGLLGGFVILCLQLQFGYLCYETWYTRYFEVWNDVGTISEHILLFGGFGVFFAITYGLVLFFSYSNLLNSKSNKDKLKAILLAHIIAFMASSTAIVVVWESVLGLILFFIYLMAVYVIFGIGYTLVVVGHAIKKLYRQIVSKTMNNERKQL